MLDVVVLNGLLLKRRWQTRNRQQRELLRTNFCRLPRASEGQGCGPDGLALAECLLFSPAHWSRIRLPNMIVDWLRPPRVPFSQIARHLDSWGGNSKRFSVRLNAGRRPRRVRISIVVVNREGRSGNSDRMVMAHSKNYKNSSIRSLNIA